MTHQVDHAHSAGALRGYPVTATVPTTDQVLTWDGSAWVPAGKGGHWGQSWSGSGAGLTLLSSDGTGLYGEGDTGVYGRGDTYGVHGYTEGDSVRGVYGSATGLGSYGVYGSATGDARYGVYGSADRDHGYGVYAEADGDYGRAVYGSATGSNSHAVYGSATGSNSHAVYGSATGGAHKGVYGSAEGDYGIGVHGYASGDYGYGVCGSASGSGSYGVYFSGGLAGTGTKSAIVDTQDYGWRHLYAVESPENWFEDFGTAQLVDGQAEVTIEPIFAQTVNLSETYQVFLTPLGDCGLYVAEKSPTTFTVQVLGGQTCSISFDYRIVAKRLGYEDTRLEPAEAPPSEEPGSQGGR